MVEHIDKTTLGEDVSRKEQLGIVSHRSETAVDDRIVMTPSVDQYGKLLGDLCVVIKQVAQT